MRSLGVLRVLGGPWIGAALLAGAAHAAELEDEPEGKWTFLIYAAADNNADGHVFPFLDAVRARLGGRPGVEVVLFIDRHERYSVDASLLGEDFTGARLYRLTDGAPERLAGGPELPDARLDREWEADSGDPRVLGDFVRFGKRHYPARNVGLLIYSHADGVTMCPDEATRTEIDLATFPEQAGAGADVDWAGLELCLMGGLEIAYAWRPRDGVPGFSTDVLVAIPNAGPALDWGRILGGFRPDLTPADLGRLAVREGGRARDEAAALEPATASDLESVACYDLARAEHAKQAWDALAIALAAAPDAREVVARLRGGVMNYVHDDLESPYAYVDAVDLARRVEACEELPAPARDAARAARGALDGLVLASFGMQGYAGFVAGENGIFVSFPSRGAWADHAWYARTAFARDGATPGDGVVRGWFELLDLWLDEGGGGGVNGFAP